MNRRKRKSWIYEKKYDYVERGYEEGIYVKELDDLRSLLTDYAVNQLCIGSFVGITGYHSVNDGSITVLRYGETIAGTRTELRSIVIDIPNADYQCGHIKVLCIDQLSATLRGALLAYSRSRRHGHAIGIPHIDGQHIASLRLAIELTSCGHNATLPVYVEVIISNATGNFVAEISCRIRRKIRRIRNGLAVDIRSCFLIPPLTIVGAMQGLCGHLQHEAATGHIL